MPDPSKTPQTGERSELSDMPTLAEAAHGLRNRRTTAVELIEGCLQAIAARDTTIQAWCHVDADGARGRAEQADAERLAAADTGGAAGELALGALHGLPIGVKDIVDTADMPTENGTPIHSGRRPESDARIVTALREAGANIIGKTVTTELAVFHPGPTCNPANPAHTPGGSSSGSAAAVAAGMVPAAIATQTAGSILRPASYCGVVGVKPTFGLVPRTGVIAQCPELDTIGVITRTVLDAAMVLDAIAAFDPSDTATATPARKGPDLTTALSLADSLGQPQPRFRRLRSAVDGVADDAAWAALDGFITQLLGAVDDLTVPHEVAAFADWQRALQMAGIAANYGPIIADHADRASDRLKELIAEGVSVSAVAFQHAAANRTVTADALEAAMGPADALITLAAPGSAPQGLDYTGHPAMNVLATYTGCPAITLPLLDMDDMPLGIQLIGRRQSDAELLAAARWLERVAGLPTA